MAEDKQKLLDDPVSKLHSVVHRMDGKESPGSDYG